MSYHVWVVPLVALALAQIATIATSVYLHRALAHRGLRLHPITDVCFRAVLWLTTGQSRREWVAVHRKHHTSNNHHAHPRAPKFSMRRFEFDPSWVVIRCLARVGLLEIVAATVALPRAPGERPGPGGGAEVGSGAAPRARGHEGSDGAVAVAAREGLGG